MRLFLSIVLSLFIILNFLCTYVSAGEKNMSEEERLIRLIIQKSNKVGTQSGYVGRALCARGYDKDKVNDISTEFGMQTHKEVMRGYLEECK